MLMRELAGQEIGARIAQARKEAGGMTQDELADLLGVSMRSVQNYEAGEVVPWRHFELLGEIFNRSLSWFLHGLAEPEHTESAQLADLLARLEAIVVRLEEGQAHAQDG